MVELLVTCMEMTRPPDGPGPDRPVDGAGIALERPRRADYLALYRAVGAPWDWDQRMRMAPAALDAFLGSAATAIHVLRLDGQAVGFCEFDGIGSPEVELCNFGLVPAAQGRRLGPWLLDRALRAAWAGGPRRIWLRTDTNDHPRAQAAYARAGFRVVSRRVESFED